MADSNPSGGQRERLGMIIKIRINNKIHTLAEKKRVRQTLWHHRLSSEVEGFLKCQERVNGQDGKNRNGSFLNRFHLSDSDSSSYEEVGDPIFYATSRPLTLSWRIRKPSTSLESLWHQRVLENPNSRKKE
ncbi:hypothetical protein AVEN_238074-1 [Araneus ventricosus]|uniref:Uncharacterized protein n=1 Tax=Araneus ventricosus TaxID=182803 RepID=A0A4Y2UI27_ARAVE|nr:hypothetical protein AVEN_238074-1 [Araneus ventricosus]